MPTYSLNGDQALAYGALAAGVKLVTSYPGSPSSGTVAALIELAACNDLYLEWSSNEKVAMEMGIGASMAGRRALVCVKSVGLNAMIDPLMALNLTPVNGGLIILLGDDPGAYGSQNDQDSRSLAHLLEMPMLEPSSPSEGHAMIQEAFSLSEKFQTTIIIRVTRSFTQQKELLSVSEGPFSPTDLGLVREAYRFVPVPKNAVEKHRALHRMLDRFLDWAEGTTFNMKSGDGTKGIIASGFAYQKLLDILGNEPQRDLQLLKLGILYPFPRRIITEFLRGCREVLVVEESEPFLEPYIKSIAFEERVACEIYGSQSRHLSREGELFRWQIQQALALFSPDLVPVNTYLKENEVDERPHKTDYCSNCGYSEILACFFQAADFLGQKPVLIGDPGCLVTAADHLDAKYAMGSAVGVADGVSKAGSDDRAVAIFGDSAFFHTALPAICNAVHNRSNILMIVLDNKTTATSGNQPNPGVGRDAMGNSAPALDIEQIVRACGVQHVFIFDPDNPEISLRETFLNALKSPELTLVIVRIKR